MKPVPRGSVSVRPVLSLPAILLEQGADPGQVFTRAGVDFGLFRTGEEFMPYRDLGRLLEIAAADAGCPHLGLLVGARCDVSAFGPIGALAANAPSIGAALDDLVRHMPTWDRAAVISLTSDIEYTTLSFVIEMPDIPGARLIREGCVAIMVRVLRDLLGASWNPDLVLFPHKPQGPEDPFRQYFGAPVHFGSGISGIVFPKLLLNRRVSSADETLRVTLREQITASEAARDMPFADQTRRQILLSLSVGLAEQPGIARALGVNVSTMRRRLAREGTNFREIAHAIRYETAKHLIRDTGLSLAEVASMLGYAELSVFTRAFRRWSGLPPSEWRGRIAGGAT